MDYKLKLTGNREKIKKAQNLKKEFFVSGEFKLNKFKKGLLKEDYI